MGVGGEREGGGGERERETVSEREDFYDSPG